jgi:hypothetical protein
MRPELSANQVSTGTMLIIPVTTQTSPVRIWTPNTGKKADDPKSIPVPSTSNRVCGIVRPSPSDRNACYL